MNNIITVNKIPVEMPPEQQAVYEIVFKAMSALSLNEDFNSNQASKQENNIFQKARGNIQDYSLVVSMKIVQAIEKIRKEQRHV